MNDEFATASREALGRLGEIPLDEEAAWAVAADLGWFDVLGELDLPLPVAAGLCRVAGEFAFPGPVVEAIATGSASTTVGWGADSAVAHVGRHTTSALLVNGAGEVFTASLGDGLIRRGEATSFEGLLDRWLYLGAAYHLGMAEAALARSVAYAKIREQFGRPIGSFQAVQQILAQMHVEVFACDALVTGAGPAEDMIGLRAFVDRAVRAVIEQAIQVHGGIGFTREVPLHLYLRRTLADARTTGSPDALADLVGSR